MSAFDDFGTALDETPDNINFLSPLVFRFMVKKTPTLNFYVQNVNLPGMHLQQSEFPNPLVAVATPGDHILYDDLMINFKVNEDFTNWLEIHNWITSLGFPKNYNQHAALTAPSVNIGEGLKSDVSLVIMNSSRIPRWNIVFRNAFPISISSLIFDTTRSRDDYIDAACTFRYDYYDFEEVV